MTPKSPRDPFDRLREIVLGARRVSPERRAEFLDGACGDDRELRREAEALLAFDEDPASLLDNGAAIADGATGRAHPKQVGAYRIEEILGEGGMGSVYRAVQEQPIRREVALKLIRRGMDSAGVIARFEAERRTLARMEHPNIAKVLDAGEDEFGHPFFVMELVRGVPITDWMRERNLGTRERVRIILQVVQAIRHAHRNGIIHRDLKPSNILLTEIQGKPIPKVIDFGVAKAIEEPEIGADFRTRTGQLLGTPEFMSPEQARGDIDAIDVRSDVYSLGVIAYELLTGELPLPLRGLPLHEVVQRICEEDPRSMRGLTGGSGRRLDADLDTVVSKCLEKEPDRRYASAAELADDLERWLEARPIHAHAPSTAYQLHKFVARNRSLAVIVSLSLLFLIVYGLTVSVQLGRQTQERRRAEAEARKAERITELLQEIISSPDLDKEGPDVTVLEALAVARREAAISLSEEPEVRAAVLKAIGISYRSAGRHVISDSLLREARDVLVAAVGPRHHDVLGIRLELANTLYFEQKRSEAEKEVREVLLIDREEQLLDASQRAHMLSLLAVTLKPLGPPHRAEAESLSLRALAIQRGVVAENPTDERAREELASYLETLAGNLYPQGRLDEAESLVRETLAIKRSIRPEGSGVATSLHNLAFLLRRQGKAAAAEPIFREALALDIALKRDAVQLAMTYTHLGICLADLGQRAEAESLLVHSLALRREALGADNVKLLDTLRYLAKFYLATDRPEESVECAREHLRILRYNGRIRGKDTANSLLTLAEGLSRTGDFGLAQLAYLDAIAIQGEILGDDNETTLRSCEKLADLQIRVADHR